LKVGDEKTKRYSGRRRSRRLSRIRVFVFVTLESVNYIGSLLSQWFRNTCSWLQRLVLFEQSRWRLRHGATSVFAAAAAGLILAMAGLSVQELQLLPEYVGR
jgi:hypothetical protein